MKRGEKEKERRKNKRRRRPGSRGRRREKEEKCGEKMRGGFNGISPRALSRARALTTSATASGPEILENRKIPLKGIEPRDYVSSFLRKRRRNRIVFYLFFFVEKGDK